MADQPTDPRPPSPYVSVYLARGQAEALLVWAARRPLTEPNKTVRLALARIEKSARLR